MMTPIPGNEAERLDALCALNLLDTAPEERFDSITRTAAQFFDVQIVLVSLIDSERQWFKARHGLAQTETPRSLAFCAHAIMQDDALIIENAWLDERFKDNPLVTGEPFIQFYAGHPIRSPDGFVLGAFCLIDQKPRSLSAAQIVALRYFASMVDDQLSKETLASHAASRIQQLRDSEARFTATFEQAAVGIAHIGMDGCWLKVNRKVADIIGYGQDDIRGLSSGAIAFPEDLAPWQALDLQLLEGTRLSYALETRYFHQAGHVVWVNLSVMLFRKTDTTPDMLFRKTDTTPDYFVVVIEDIQEKKLAQIALQGLNEELELRVEQRTAELRQKNEQLAGEIQHRLWTENVLRASETRIRTILNNSHDAFIDIDSDGIITDWNKAAETLFGWRREEAVGKNITATIIPLKHQHAHEEGIKRFFKYGAGSVVNRRVEMPARTRSGIDIPIEMTVTAYQIEGQYHFAAFLQDVSQRQAITRKLEQKQELLDAVLETIDVGVVACSSDGVLTLFNRAARALHGIHAVPVEEISASQYGQHCELFSADGKTCLQKNEVPLFRALNGETIVDAEMVIAPAGRSANFLLASGRPLVSPSGEKLGAVVALKNVTDLKDSEKRLAQNEQRLRAITENLPTLIGHIDRDEKFLFLNSQSTQFFGKSNTELVGKHVNAAYSKAGYGKVKPFIDAALSGDRASFEDQMLVNGETHHYHATYIPDKDASGAVKGFYAMAYDITARKMSELCQAESDERLRTIANNLPVLIAYLDRDMRYQFANAKYEEWHGISPDRMRGKSVAELFGTDFFEQRKQYVLRCLDGETVCFENAIGAADLHRELESTYIPHMKDGIAQGFYVLSSDITTVKSQERMLRQLARSDALTGLPNRRGYSEKLQDTVDRSPRYGRGFAVMFLDVDNFKRINDTQGHGAGDDVLKEIAQRLLASVRETDTVSRLAGDEFTIILDNVITQEDAVRVAQKILDAIRRPFVIAGISRNVSISIGITCVSGSASDVASITKAADDALYQAKAAGRNGYCIDGSFASKAAPEHYEI